MNIVNNHVHFPDPFKRGRVILEMTYYAIRIVYVTVLIIVTLLVLGGIIG